MTHPLRLLTLLALVLMPLVAGEAGPKPKKGKAVLPPIPKEGPTMAGATVVQEPFAFSTDVGETKAQQEAYARRLLGPILNTTDYFIRSFGMKPTCFKDYAAVYSAGGQKWEPLIRICIWRRHEDFLTNFQARHQTRTVPGAYFAWGIDHDVYGKPTGTSKREIATAAEDTSDEQVLREIYHEMGHLFMVTYIFCPVEVPSWVQEGVAQLFQYRVGNGTRPEVERLQRTGWMREILAEGNAIPWPELIRVRNMDNLDFTWKDPARAAIQYTQTWSVMEYMVSDARRQDALMKLLRRFKEKAEGEFRDGKLKSDKDRTGYLYGIQETLFKECYGIELIKVEDLWRKDWVENGYESELKRNPALRYYRGDWHLSVRTRLARDKAARDLALDRAQALFAECVQETPKLALGQVGLGRVAMERGDLKTAQDCFDKALELGGKDFEVRLYGGLARLAAGQADKAIEALAGAVAMTPTSAEANLAYARALAATGKDLLKAAQHAARAREQQADLTPQAAWLEATALSLAGKPKPAYRASLRISGGGIPSLPVFLALFMVGDDDEEGALSTLDAAGDDPIAPEVARRLRARLPLPALAIGPNGWPTLKADWLHASPTGEKRKEQQKPLFGPDGEDKTDGQGKGRKGK